MNIWKIFRLGLVGGLSFAHHREGGWGATARAPWPHQQVEEQADGAREGDEEADPRGSTAVGVGGRGRKL